MEMQLKNKLRIKSHTINKLHLIEDNYGCYRGSNYTTEKLFPFLISLSWQSLHFVLFLFLMIVCLDATLSQVPLGITELGIIFALR